MLVQAVPAALLGGAGHPGQRARLEEGALGAPSARLRLRAWWGALPALPIRARSGGAVLARQSFRQSCRHEEHCVSSQGGRPASGWARPSLGSWGTTALALRLQPRLGGVGLRCLGLCCLCVLLLACGFPLPLPAFPCISLRL